MKNLERRKTLWKLQRKVLDSDFSPAMSLERFNLLSMSPKQFPAEKDVVSFKLTLASAHHPCFGYIGGPDADGASTRVAACRWHEHPNFGPCHIT